MKLDYISTRQSKQKFSFAWTDRLLIPPKRVESENKKGHRLWLMSELFIKFDPSLNQNEATDVFFYFGEKRFKSMNLNGRNTLLFSLTKVDRVIVFEVLP